MDKKKKKYTVVYIPMVMERKKELELFISFFIRGKDHVNKKKILEKEIFLPCHVNSDWNPQGAQIFAEDDKNRGYFSCNSPSSKEAR